MIYNILTILEDVHSPVHKHTHALVMFATDEAISVVPRKKIMESDDNLSLQQSCTVQSSYNFTHV